MSVCNGIAWYGRKSPRLGQHSLSSYYMPGYVLSTLQILIPTLILILIIVLPGMYCYLHLADEEIEAQRIRPQFKSMLCHLLAVRPWAKKSFLLNFHPLSYKTEMALLMTSKFLVL